MPRAPLPLRSLAVAAAALATLLGAAPLAAQTPADAAARVDVRLHTAQAEGALRAAEAFAAGGAPSDSAWRALLATDGHARLVQRERSLGRSLDDTTFRAFLASPVLAARLPALRATLHAWSALDPQPSAARVFAYLPPGTRLRATIYPVVKPATNSFVFETGGDDPAIFLYLDPAVSAAKFENTLAHELHHVGITAGCGALPDSARLSDAERTTLRWMGALHEGVAMLAAAGGPDVHPHAASDGAERLVWERDLGRAAADVRALERFWTELLDGRLAGADVQPAAMRFFSTDSVPQGAHYTVGWLLASTIERELGRARLVSSLCDPRLLLGAYEEAAARQPVAKARLPHWSPAFLRRLGVP